MADLADNKWANNADSATNRGATSCHLVRLVTAAASSDGGQTRLDCPALPEVVLSGLDATNMLYGKRPGFAARLQSLAAERSLGSLVIVAGHEKECPIHVPPPLAVPCEPIELDEAQPALVALCDAPSTDATPVVPVKTRASRWWSMAFRPNLPVFFLAVFLLFGLPGLIIAPRPLMALMWGWMLAASLISVIVERRRFGRWFIVPGGIVIRKTLAGRFGQTVRLFTPGDTLLWLTPFYSGWQVELFQAGRRAVRLLTKLETTALLAAWRSPIPAPPLERLTDLE